MRHWISLSKAMPLEELKKQYVDPLIKTMNHGVETQHITNLTTFQENPICGDKSLKKNHDTWLYALERSIFTTKSRIKEHLIVWRVSCAQSTSSWINHP